MRHSDWLLPTRSQIVNLTVGSANTESLMIELVNEQTKIKKTKSLAVDESVWAVTNAALAMGILMAGKDENIHTIRIPVFTLGISANQERTDRVYRPLSDLLSNVFPDWPEARGWPMSRLKEAWNILPAGDQEDAYRPPMTLSSRKHLAASPLPRLVYRPILSSIQLWRGTVVFLT
jgi:hypothetical protein